MKVSEAVVSTVATTFPIAGALLRVTVASLQLLVIVEATSVPGVTTRLKKRIRVALCTWLAVLGNVERLKLKRPVSVEFTRTSGEEPKLRAGVRLEMYVSWLNTPSIA
jgi:hypothetical protein